MLLGTLGASLSGIILAGKEIVRAGYGKKKDEELYEKVTGIKLIFNAASSFK